MKGFLRFGTCQIVLILKAFWPVQVEEEQRLRSLFWCSTGFFQKGVVEAYLLTIRCVVKTGHGGVDD